MLLEACVPSATWKNRAAPPTQPGTSPFYCKRGIKQLFVPLSLEMHQRQTRGEKWSLFEGGVGSRRRKDSDHKAVLF